MTFMQGNLTVTSNAQDIYIWLQGTQNILSAQLGVWMRTEMVPALKRRARERFLNEGDEVVGAWLPLAEATKEIRRRQGFPPEHPINQRTYQLVDWITRTNSPRIVSGFGWAEMSYPGNPPSKTLEDKLRTAQAGKAKSKVSSGKVRGTFGPTPPRPVLGIGAKDAATAITLLSQYFLAQCAALRVTGMRP